MGIPFGHFQAHFISIYFEKTKYFRPIYEPSFYLRNIDDIFLDYIETNYEKIIKFHC